MTDATPAEAIGAAIERISSADDWCRGSFAVDADGDAVHPDDDTAVRWCAIGALRRGCKTAVAYEAIYAVTDELRATTAHAYLYSFNDSEGHAETLALLRRAQARLTAQDAETTASRALDAQPLENNNESAHSAKEQRND